MQGAYTVRGEVGEEAVLGTARSWCLGKVPVVCTHSLRGLYATLAVESGAVAATVAASLGHGSFTMTERHYAAPESVMNARTARVAGILPSTQSADFNNSELLAHLRHLDSDTLTRLISLAQQAGATPNH